MESSGEREIEKKKIINEKQIHKNNDCFEYMYIKMKRTCIENCLQQMHHPHYETYIQQKKFLFCFCFQRNNIISHMHEAFDDRFFLLNFYCNAD